MMALKHTSFQRAMGVLECSCDKCVDGVDAYCAIEDEKARAWCCDQDSSSACCSFSCPTDEAPAMMALKHTSFQRAMGVLECSCDKCVDGVDAYCAIEDEKARAWCCDQDSSSACCSFSCP